MTKPAAIYCRISDDREGMALGVSRQEEDCRALAARLGYSVAEDAVFVDNDISASTRSKKARPQYAAMLKRADDGEFAAVLAYSNSRLTRRPLELEGLIRLHESTGTIVSTVASGEDNLSTADGRMVARIKASVDAAEAERVSERLIRKHRQTAETGGVVGGTRPFGWQDDRRTLNPVEAEAARQAVRGFLAGKTLYALVVELHDKGIVTTKGNEWTLDSLRKYLANPRMCGWRMLRGEVVRAPDGSPIVGEWEPIVNPETWEAVDGRLQARKGKRFGPSGPTGGIFEPGWDKRKYLLSGFLRCGKEKSDGTLCMTMLRATTHRDVQSHLYVCPGKYVGGCGGIGRHGQRLESYVIESVLNRAEQADTEKPTMEAWRDESVLAEVERRRNALNAAWTESRVSDETYFGQLETLESQIKGFRRERGRWHAVRAAAEALPGDLRAEWTHREGDLDWCRSVIARHMRSIIILPAGKGAKKFRPETVRLVWRED